MRKKKLLIITMGFFNKHGNQSLFETIRAYREYFDITIITCADLNENFYFSLEEIDKKLPNINIIPIRHKWIILIKWILNKINSFRYLQKKGINNHQNYIMNLDANFFHFLAYKMHNNLLYKAAKNHIYKTKNLPCYICAYEIHGVIPTLKLQKKFNSSIISFGKFQGTVLGSVIEQLESKKIVKQFKMDIHAMHYVKNLDYCIMTNDGTRGDEVLHYYGVPKENVLFIQNGIPNEIWGKQVRRKINLKIPIRLFIVSRFVYWKRTHLSILLMNKLVNELHDVRFILNIYGIGTKDEVKILEDLIKKFNLCEFVINNGSVSYENIEHVYTENDILISLYMFSNLGNPVMEASFFGRPVISIENQYLSNVIGDSSYGNIFINETSEEDLVQKIAFILHNMSMDSFKLLQEQASNKKNLLISWDERVNKELSFIKYFN